MFLTFVLGGMVAGTVASYAAWLPAFYAFAVLALAPIASRYFLKGDDVSAVMGGLLVLYGVALAVRRCEVVPRSGTYGELGSTRQLPSGSESII